MPLACGSSWARIKPTPQQQPRHRSDSARSLTYFATEFLFYFTLFVFWPNILILKSNFTKRNVVSSAGSWNREHHFDKCNKVMQDVNKRN